MAQIKRVTQTMFLHRKADGTDRFWPASMDEYGTDYYGVCMGEVECTIEYEDIEADPTAKLVESLQASLEKERKESMTRQLQIQEKINSLLAIEFKPE